MLSIFIGIKHYTVFTLNLQLVFKTYNLLIYTMNWTYYNYIKKTDGYLIENYLHSNNCNNSVKVQDNCSQPLQ